MGFTMEKIKRVSFLYKCEPGAREQSSLPHKCGVPEARGERCIYAAERMPREICPALFRAFSSNTRHDPPA